MTIGGYRIGGAPLGGSIAAASSTPSVSFPTYLLLDHDGHTYLLSGGSAMPDFYLAKGDLLPVISGQFVDANLDPISLSGAATVRFVSKDRDTGTVLINQAATIVDGDTGRVSYQWQVADTLIKREGLARFEAVVASGQPIKAPNVGFINVHVGD